MDNLPLIGVLVSLALIMYLKISLFYILILPIGVTFVIGVMIRLIQLISETLLELVEEWEKKNNK